MLPMATRVPIKSAQKPYAAFPLPYMYVFYMKFDHILSYILLWKCEQTMTTDHQYTHYHTSLEPLTQVS